MSSIFRLLPFRNRIIQPIVGEQSSNPDLKVTDHTKGKESSDVSVEAHGVEITTAKDPTLNPGELSFEEGGSSSKM
jgi:hypothetical protein